MLPWSEHQSELDERLGKPAVGFGVGADFVVSAADVLNGGVPGADDLDGAQPLQPSHRPQPGFEPAMVSFDLVVGVPDVDVAGGGQLFVEDPWYRRLE